MRGMFVADFEFPSDAVHLMKDEGEGLDDPGRQFGARDSHDGRRIPDRALRARFRASTDSRRPLAFPPAARAISNRCNLLQLSDFSHVIPA